MSKSNQKPMADTVKENALIDCAKILSNVFETSAEALSHLRELTDMAYNNASETMIYARLQEITDQEEKDG